jgi:UDP-glucose 4-epimerase
MIEHALRDYASAYRLQSISLRYFNAAGADPACRACERHDPAQHLILPVLAEAMLTKVGGNPAETTLRVSGTVFEPLDGSCARDYIHVNDLYSAHLAAARRPLSARVAGAEAFNLAKGGGFSVHQVIHVRRQVAQQAIQWRGEPRLAGESAALVGNASSATAVLDWKLALATLRTIVESAWTRMDCEDSK